MTTEQPKLLKEWTLTDGTVKINDVVWIINDSSAELDHEFGQIYCCANTNTDDVLCVMLEHGHYKHVHINHLKKLSPNMQPTVSNTVTIF